MKLVLFIILVFAISCQNPSYKLFKTENDIELYMHFSQNKELRDVSDVAIIEFHKIYHQNPGVLKRIQTYGLAEGTYRLFYESRKGKSTITVRVNRNSGKKVIESIKTTFWLNNHIFMNSLKYFF